MGSIELGSMGHTLWGARTYEHIWGVPVPFAVRGVSVSPDAPPLVVTEDS